MLLIFSFDILTLKNFDVSIFFNIYVDINPETSNVVRGIHQPKLLENCVDRPYIEIVTLDALLFCGHNINIIFRGIQGSKTYFGKKSAQQNLFGSAANSKCFLYANVAMIDEIACETISVQKGKNQ